MAEAFRRHKSFLRASYYNTFNNDEERMKNCPPKIAQEDWDEFLKNEATPEASGRRESGKKNRSLLRYGHHAGHKSQAKIEQVVASPLTNIKRRQGWEKTHTKKDDSISDATSSYFDQIAKEKEKITDSDEEKLTVDEDILSQVFGKDARGRSRSDGTMIPKSNVNACAVAQKRLRHARGDNDELKMRVESLERIVGNLSGQIELLIGMVGNIEQGIRAPVNSSDGGRGTQFNAPEFVAPQFLNSTNVADNQTCEILNSDLDTIAIGTICRDSTSSKIHGKSVPSTHEKLVLDNILLPDERTSKINHHFTETFADVGEGGYVCHPKGIIRYL